MMRPIRKGDVCVWQNMTDELAYLNGTECTAESDMIALNCCAMHRGKFGHETDIKVMWHGDVLRVFAYLGEIRPRNMPTDHDADVIEKEFHQPTEKA